jgi:ferritin
LNICCSSRVKPGASVNSYTYIKAIAEETGLEVIADWIDNQSDDKRSIMWKDHVFIGKKI